MHGYEILQALRAAEIDLWFPISPATIYYSLEKLRRQGLVSESRARGRGPERTVYYITDRGRDAFFAALEAALASQELTRFEYHGGILLLNKLPQDRALALLEQRRAFLHRRAEELKEALQHAAGDPLRGAILKHVALCVRGEQEWLEGIIRHLRGEEVQEYRGLMLLSGDPRDFHLPDVLKLIASGRYSGTLTVTDGVVTRTLTFREGQPVCASSRRADGPVRDPVQIMNDIYDLFRWQEGAFTFDQRFVSMEECLVLHIRIQDLILAGARWADNWAIIQRVVPSPEAVFERRNGAVAEGIELTPEERCVWEALDGIRDVTDVARACDLTEFETSKILYTLHAAGLIQPGEMDKIRLRRCFREVAELLCRATKPYRASPDDFSCEEEVNRRCADLPIRFYASRIEDRTDPALPTEELAAVYRRFLETQRAAIRERFGEERLAAWRAQVVSQISPGLQKILRQYRLV
jgi:DNA-binding PadR family transcriptional regulator